MERKIGEIFEDRGCWYQCLESSSRGCDYCDYGDCHKIACASGERSDDKEVHFKKLEKIGKPYLAHDNSRNKDVIVQDYKLHSQYACYNGHEEMLVFSYNGHKGTVTIKTNEPIYKKIKKDMEEKYSELTGIVHEYMEKDMTYKDFKEAIDYWVDDYIANKSVDNSNLKPFSLEAAKAGKPVCTRDGRKARIICFDRKFLYHGQDYCIVALINEGCYSEAVYSYTNDGLHTPGKIHNNDLMMLQKKKG